MKIEASYRERAKTVQTFNPHEEFVRLFLRKIGFIILIFRVALLSISRLLLAGLTLFPAPQSNFLMRFKRHISSIVKRCFCFIVFVSVDPKVTPQPELLLWLDVFDRFDDILESMGPFLHRIHPPSDSQSSSDLARTCTPSATPPQTSMGSSSSSSSSSSTLSLAQRRCLLVEVLRVTNSLLRYGAHANVYNSHDVR